MSWQPQMQHRQQYTLDGSTKFAWQPTMAYKPGAGQGTSFDEAVTWLSLFLSAFFAFVLYHEVGKVALLSEASESVQFATQCVTAFTVFLSSFLILQKPLFRFLVGIGVTCLCLAWLFWPALL